MADQVSRAADRSEVGFTLRDLDKLVADATAAGVDWDSVVYIRGTRWAGTRAPGVPFTFATVGPEVRFHLRKTRA